VPAELVCEFWRRDADHAQRHVLRLEIEVEVVPGRRWGRIHE
jgi:hypothetical protein